MNLRLYAIVGSMTLTGCALVPCGELPVVDPAADIGTEPVSKRRIRYRFDSKYPGQEIGSEAMRSYWAANDLMQFKNSARKSGLVSVCLADGGEPMKPGEVAISVDSMYKMNTVGAFFTGLTLCIIPFPCYHSYVHDITVRDWKGLERQYHFSDEWREHVCSPILLLFMPFCETSHDAIYERVVGNIYNNLLLDMRKDGFFSGDIREETRSDMRVEKDEKKAAERRKDLEDLRKAGIIGEAEFAAEMKKLEGDE